MHACSYCYARPSHEYLDFGAGTDFDRKIVIKSKAATLLRQAFLKRSWKGELILLSGNTDCYQPLEATYELTRACLKVCAEFKNPIAVITKSALVERDADLLAQLAAEASCFVTMSIPFMNAEHCRQVEPFAPTPERRLRTLRHLHEAGVPVGVNIAPIIPGLNDNDVPAILEAAQQAGATRAGYSLVRLPGAVNEVFEERIRAAFPLRAERILHRIEDCRGGHRNEGRYGHRMSGTGRYWEAISTLFRTTAKRLGLDVTGRALPIQQRQEESTFRRPGEGEQLALWPQD